MGHFHRKSHLYDLKDKSLGRERSIDLGDYTPVKNCVVSEELYVMSI